MSQKTLQLLAIVIAIVFIAAAFHLAAQVGESSECEAWQTRPDLWVEWRIEQCEELGVPLPVTP